MTDTGALGGKLLGIVTAGDTAFLSDRGTLLEEVMTRRVTKHIYGEHLLCRAFGKGSGCKPTCIASWGRLQAWLGFLGSVPRFLEV